MVGCQWTLSRTQRQLYFPYASGCHVHRGLQGYDGRTKDDATPKAVEKKKVEIGEDRIQTNGLVALSKYFEDRMEAMKGYVPVCRHKDS